MQTNQIKVLTINIDSSWKLDTLWVMVHNYEPLAYGACGMELCIGIYRFWKSIDFHGLWLDQAGSMPYRVVLSRYSVHGYV